MDRTPRILKEFTYDYEYTTDLLKAYDETELTVAECCPREIYSGDYLAIVEALVSGAWGLDAE